MQRYVLLFILYEFCTVFSLNVGGGRCARYARASLAPTHPPQRHAGGTRQLRRFDVGQHALLRRARCPTRWLRSACVPCSSGRAVVGTAPGASHLAALGALHPTQSRHITCAASPLSVEKLPPTADGTPRRRRTRPLLFGQSGCRHYSGCKPPRCARRLCTLRRADTLLVRLRRLASRNYHCRYREPPRI